MMFSLSLAVLLLCTFGIHGNTIERGYPFGKLRLAEEGKNEELIATINTEKVQLNQDQPLPSPCIGTNPSTKIAYPKDKTKYIQCRDEFHYEIFTCPNGGEYNEQTNVCDATIPVLDRCEQEKPCLNDGQCTLLSNSTFKCICRADWTGDRCETPINSCVNKPCGPNAECRTLKTTDYEQDYVCVCHATQGYGLNCQETAQNPCLITDEQFFPYAFSQRAYIQCDGDLIYFQPCGPSLYWIQDEKICDRKRPPKVDLTALLAKLVTKKNEEEKENQKETVNEEINLTGKTVETEQQSSLTRNTKENEKVFAFQPARLATRQQFQLNANSQQGQFGQNEQQTEQLSNQLPQSVETNQNRQGFISSTNQWPNRQVESTVRQTPTTQTGQNQFWPQNTQQQQQGASSLSEASSINSNLGQFQTKQEFPQQNQGFGNQQWLNQIPDVKTQNDQRFGSQSQSWQGSQTARDQPQFQSFQNSNLQRDTQSWQNKPDTVLTNNQSPQTTNFNAQNTQTFASQPQPWQNTQLAQNQQPFIETTTVAQNVNRLPGSGFQNTNEQTQEQSWQNQQNTQTFASKPQSWQNTQLTQNQQPSFETTTVAQNALSSQGFQNSNAQVQDLSWQNKPNIQSTGFNTQNTQTFASKPQAWQNTQLTQNQQPFIETTTVAENVVPLQGFQSTNAQVQDLSWQNKPNVQSTGFNAQNTQTFASKPQSWQSSQLTQNQQPFIETTTVAQNVVPLQAFQNTKGQAQDQLWQNRPNIQSSGFQPVTFNTQNTQNFAPQTQSWQSSQLTQNQQPLIETTTLAQNVVSLQAFQNSNAQVQDQPWQNKPKTQSTGYQSTGFQTQNTQNFAPSLQSWQNPKPQQLTPTNTEGLSFDNKNRLNTGIYQNNQYGFEQQNAQNQQSWQNKGTNQVRQNFPQLESSLIDIQQIPLNNEQSFSDQTQQLPSTGFKTNQIQNFPQQNQGFGSQQWLNQVPDVKTQNTQRFGSQPQSWQAAQPNQNFVPTTTPGQNINQYQGYQNTQGQVQSWQNKLNTPQIQTQGDQLQSNTVFAFQPKQWPETSKQTQMNPSSEIQTTQFGVNQQQGGLSSQLKDSDDFNVQANQNFVARPPLETSTLMNKGIHQGMYIQGSNNWKPRL